MSTRCIKGALALTIGASAIAACPPVASGSTATHIVVLSDSTNRPGAVARRHASRLRLRVQHVYRHAFKGYAARVPAGRLVGLRGLPDVRGVERNVPLAPASDAPQHPSELYLKKHQILPTGVDRIEADRSSTRAGDGRGSLPGPGVAVLDSGISEHPDLDLRGGIDCTGTGGYHDDWTEDFRFLDGPHGTPVAGVIGAKDNHFGVVGIAPHVPLYAVKVLSLLPSGAPGGFYDDLLCGLDWLVANASGLDIRVANMSLAAPALLPSDVYYCGPRHFGGTSAIAHAICAATDAGVTLVAAAGHGGNRAGSGHRGEPLNNHSPANLDEVLAVTGMADFDGRPGSLSTFQPQPPCRQRAADDAPWDGSNYALGVPGSPVDGPSDTIIGRATQASQREDDSDHTVAAPSRCIASTFPDGRYALFDGTSFAAPHAAGVIALCIASGPCRSLTPREIIAKVRADALAQPLTYGFIGDPWHGGAIAPYYGPLVHAGGY